MNVSPNNWTFIPSLPGFHTERRGGTQQAEELYDSQRDPHETVNLATSREHRKTLDRLRAALARWIDESKDQGKTLEPAELAAAKGATKPGSNPNATAIFKKSSQ